MANKLADVVGYETYLELEITHSFQIIPTTLEEVARIMANQRPIKVARFIPFYKKNAPDELGNYRPVSLLSELY